MCPWPCGRPTQHALPPPSWARHGIARHPRLRTPASLASAAPAALPHATLPRFLLSRRLLIGIVCISAAALALGAAAIAACLALLGPLSGPFLLACALTAVAAEAAFGLIWWPRLKARLEALPLLQNPASRDPDKDFQSVLSLARLARAKQAGAGAADGQSAGGAGGDDTDQSDGSRQIFDIELFLEEWFSGADISKVRRGNLAELLAYGFYYKTLSEMEAAGMGDVPQRMAQQLEEATGLSLQPGYNPGLTAMFHLWEPLSCSWRPLTFYAITEFLAGWTRACMVLVLGFSVVSPRASATAQQSGQQSPVETAAADKQDAAPGVYSHYDGDRSSSSSSRSSPAGSGSSGDSPQPSQRLPTISVYVRRPPLALSQGALQGNGATANGDGSEEQPQTSGRSEASPLDANATPILFLHGVGGGLLAYLPFVDRLVRLGRTVICVEAPHVSMRLCAEIPTPDEVADDVVAALDGLGVKKVAVVAHSYGTFVASCLVQQHRLRLRSLCLIDPVCLGIFLPNLLSGFVYRRSRLPDSGSLRDSLMRHAMHQISMEVHIAATFCRRFFWTNVNLFKLIPRTLVVLAGRDELLHAEEILYMLKNHTRARVMFHKEQVHAGVLLDAAIQNAIVEELAGM